MRAEPYPAAAVIGGGPAGLMAAEVLSAVGVRVTLFDRMPSVGRKLLMAGRGGLNLTHSEPYERFIIRYGDLEPPFKSMLDAFPPAALIAWAEGLGLPTFTGSSGRVFPRAMKASPLLRAWLARLAARNVDVRTGHDWRGWSVAGDLVFETKRGAVEVPRPAATVLALGGASWPRLGSDGAWASLLARAGVEVSPFRPANCGFALRWTEPFKARFAGQPLKNIALIFGTDRVVGEAMVTADGLEGGAVYALSAMLRDEIEARGEARLLVDLRPNLGAEALASRLSRPRHRQSSSTFLRKAAGLPPVAIALLHEVVGTNLPGDPGALAALIKALPLRLIAPQPLARAISSAGGVAWRSLNANMSLGANPDVFAAGEMLDWEAPTGGYLLQACMATGRAAGIAALSHIERCQSAPVPLDPRAPRD